MFLYLSYKLYCDTSVQKFELKWCGAELICSEIIILFFVICFIVFDFDHFLY